MQAKELLLLAALIVVITCGGCATALSRGATRYQERPHLYPATHFLWRAERGGVQDRWINTLMPPKRSDEIFQTDQVIAGCCCVFPSYLVYHIVVETPVSLATDTLLLPLDGYRSWSHGYDVRRFKRILSDAAWLQQHSEGDYAPEN